MSSTEDYSGALAVFRVIASEFADIPDEDKTDEDGNVTTYGVLSYMAVFAVLISRRRYGNKYDIALAYLTAHKLLMMGYGSSSDESSSSFGTIADSFRLSSASEGETSVSFSDNTTSDDEDSEYTLTIYGRMFLSIKRAVIVPIVSAGEPVIVPRRRRR